MRHRTPNARRAPRLAARLRIPGLALPGLGVVLAMALGAPAAAQTVDAPTVAAPAGPSPAFAGTWDVTWDQAIRSAGDQVIKVQRRGTATLTLEQHGDSLDGSWRITGVPGAEPHHVVGTARGDSIALHAPDAVIRDGGRAFHVTMRWFGVIRDGRITGTMYLQIQDGDAPPRAWEAVRREPVHREAGGSGLAR